MTMQVPPTTKGIPTRRAHDGGITLIEVLVVLAVIGVATGATMLGLNAADRDTRAEAEAVRLARKLSLGVDEALVGGTPLALIWDAGGYRFTAWSAESASWGPAIPNTLSARHDLRAPVSLSLQGEETTSPVLIASSGIGPAITFEFGSTDIGNSPNWVVDFDGFSATALPKGAP